MADPHVTIALAGLSLVVCFGGGEVYDAYRHRDHPSCDPRAEFISWSIVAGVWAAILLLAHLIP